MREIVTSLRDKMKIFDEIFNLIYCETEKDDIDPFADSTQQTNQTI